MRAYIYGLETVFVIILRAVQLRDKTDRRFTPFDDRCLLSLSWPNRPLSKIITNTTSLLKPLRLGHGFALPFPLGSLV
jgi:hypothetical protein